MLKADHLKVSYAERSVLTDVSFELAEGTAMALLGPNGAGKTTLIKALNGTVPLAGGSIEIGGRPVADLSRREIALQMAVVAQEAETRFPVTVLEFVLAGRFVNGSAFGWETDTDISAAWKALEDCGLSEYALRLMNELSGGERQRVVLARALATDARILLLDEPTANLDMAHQGMMFRLVRRRCSTQGSSAIVITHDLNLAAAFSDTALMLKEGRVAAYGEPKEVLTEANIESVFGVKVLLDRHPANDSVRITSVF